MYERLARLLRGGGAWAIAAVLLLGVAGWWLADIGPQLARALSLHPDALVPQRDLLGPPAGAASARQPRCAPGA